MPSVLDGERRLGFARERGKSLAVMHRDIGQHLAVDTDLGLLKPVHEPAVAHAALTRGGVDAYDPQRSEVTLADAPVTEGGLRGLVDRLLGDLDGFTTRVVITLGARQYFLVSGPGGNPAFYTWHGLSPQLYGSIWRTRAVSVACTTVVPPRWRLRLLLFLVKM